MSGEQAVPSPERIAETVEFVRGLLDKGAVAIGLQAAQLRDLFSALDAAQQRIAAVEALLAEVCEPFDGTGSDPHVNVSRVSAALAVPQPAEPEPVKGDYYGEGYALYALGETPADNPYDPDSEEFRQWNAGWSRARDAAGSAPVATADEETNR
jgi:hypothetical protein